ncbi:hypothetical protein E2C01_048298 [Portunus trituberculatus]|uniref:Uncharacterized protein n=1 Tax=Portunus trituberculatus TaxID=210409 RepID=A0A5B7GAC7_PORTR|nr:hypothetical protein [Portunus trituberculatus]
MRHFKEEQSRTLIACEIASGDPLMFARVHSLSLPLAPSSLWIKYRLAGYVLEDRTAPQGGKGGVLISEDRQGRSGEGGGHNIDPA